MKQVSSEDLSSDLRKALDEAFSVLNGQGFGQDEKGDWVGQIDCHTEGRIKVRVSFPSTFPFELPEIYVDRSSLPKRIPHIEKTGKVCIAPTSGVLIDFWRPAEIVSEALSRTKDVLQTGLSGRNEIDLIDEFLAYWDSDLTEGLNSISTPDGPTRQVYCAEVLAWKGYKGSNILAADDKKAAAKWAESMGKKFSESQSALFVNLNLAFLPPDFGGAYSVKDILAILKQTGTKQSIAALYDWLYTVKLPVVILMSLPLREDRGRALVAVRLPALSPKAAKEAQKGFRPGRVPAVRQLSLGERALVTRLYVTRYDGDYLIPRCGGDEELSGRTVVVVGCGSIGSYLVERLVSLGVGDLRLIDQEKLKPENVHRHSLGINTVGVNKALAIKASLGFRYPHIRVEARASKVQDVLKTDAAFIIDADLIMVALGEETLELWLNRHLGLKKPRIHVWTEPLGIGQHVLAVGVGSGNGCFECLFEPTDEFGLRNKAAFAQPGQQFQNSLAGCGGSFVPFSANDANRAAIEASSLAKDILSGATQRNVLVSRFGSAEAFTRMGFQVSKRANLFEAGEVSYEYGFPRSECTICRKLS